jgi:hypothetical protein
MVLPEYFKDVRYRVRIFDNSIFLMSAEVPDKGQRKFTMTVHKTMLGLGESTKLDFMLNPDIKPKIFGKVFEVDFDIRDSVQLGDLLDIAPELVYEINNNYRKYKTLKENQESVINADFDVNDDLTDPMPAETIAVKPPKPLADEEEDEDRLIDTVIKGVKDIAATAPYMPVLGKIIKTPEDQKQESIEKCLTLCAKHPKLLYWLPQHLKIGPEVHAIVSQSRIYRTGVIPSYYHAQSGAMIAEKVLARPKEQTGWQQVALYAVLIIGIVGTIGIIAWLLHG